MTIIETAPGGRKANRAVLEKYSHRFNETTVLCVVAGDGTVGLAIETLLLSEKMSPAAKKAPILPLWGGNANDLAVMLNGSSRTSLEHIIKNGHTVPIYPLLCTLTYGGGHQDTHVAASYISFGATAYAAARLNKKHHRRNPLHKFPGGRSLSETAATINGLIEAPLFEITQHGRRTKIYERTFVNGPRFAKLIVTPIALADKVFLMRTLHRKHLEELLSLVVSLLRGRQVGKYISEAVEFTCEHATMAQFDGEPIKLPAGTVVRVERSQRCFYAYSTLIRPTKS